MKRAPRKRDGIYDLYWYFASERQAIFERRISGELPPWTQDPILQTFKFCNVYRALDRVSQFLIRNVAYNKEPASPANRLFQILAFRMFSKIDTWTGVHAFLGRQPEINDLTDGTLQAALEYVKSVNGGLYTGAFILAAGNMYGHSAKHLNHLELFRDMFIRDDLGTRLCSADSLQHLYDMMIDYSLIGPFMAYQLAIDLNYSEHINFSENDFTQAGPGALRGMAKAFVDLGDYSPTEVIHWMVEHQDEEFDRLGLPFSGLWGRRLHAIDCQGLFCELDKYCRQAAPELSSARQRIKSRFTPTTQPLQLYFPPKWGINNRLQ